MTIKLKLPYPPSANRYWRTNGSGRVYVSDEAEDYKSEVGLIARRTIPASGDVSISIRIFRPQRSGDLDNRLKVLIDALKGIAYFDDKQITEIHAYRFDDKKDPRVEVEIAGI